MIPKSHMEVTQSIQFFYEKIKELNLIYRISMRSIVVTLFDEAQETINSENKHIVIYNIFFILNMWFNLLYTFR